MDQQIRFCTSPDGTRLAYAILDGGARNVVYVAGWPAHLELEWERPSSRELIETLAQGSRLIRYDMRGCGLSDTQVDDFSLAALVSDLKAVIAASGAESFVLLSLGMLGAPTAITYAAAHPEQVTHLVLCSAYAAGERLADEERRRAQIEYTEKFGFPVLDYVEGADPEAQVDRTGRDIVHKASAPATQAALLRTMFSSDTRSLLSRVTMPATVLHGRGDKLVPFAEGRALASELPNAEFVPIEGNTGAALTERDSTVPAIRKALAMEPASAPPSRQRSVATILFTDLVASTSLTQRLGDAKAQELVRTHNTIVRDALASHGGTEIKHTGDGIMASFPSASGALDCAIAIQRGVAAHEAAALAVKIGLNAGEPVAEESDLFGTAVQLARRVCDQASGREILVSDVVRQLAAGKDFLFSDRGVADLKGFDEPVRLFEVRWRAEGSPQETGG